MGPSHAQIVDRCRQCGAGLTMADLEKPDCPYCHTVYPSQALAEHYRRAGEQPHLKHSRWFLETFIMVVSRVANIIISLAVLTLIAAFILSLFYGMWRVEF